MKVENIFDVLGLALVLGMVTDIVTSQNSAKIVTSGGNAFASIENSALGKG